jgi:hypothetical protein
MKVGDLIQRSTSTLETFVLEDQPHKNNRGKSFINRKWKKVSSEDIGLITFIEEDSRGFTTLVLFGEQLYWILPREFKVLHESR